MKQLLVFLFLLCTMSVSAQDVIVKKDGSTVVCRVVEVTATEITYKKWTDLNGSIFVMDKSLVSGINYESGKKETFGVVDNLYEPNNQYDGVQQYNDKALLAIDYVASNSYKKVRKLKTIGWIGGAILAAGGVITIAAGNGVSEYNMVGAGLGIGAVAWTTSFLLIAQQSKKHIDEKTIRSISFYQYDFNINNGSKITASIDILSDNFIGNNTLGLGLRYNF